MIFPIALHLIFNVVNFFYKHFGGGELGGS